MLRKQGHFVKNWKERWFVLQGDKLFYFKARTDPRPQGCVTCKVRGGGGPSERGEADCPRPPGHVRDAHQEGQQAVRF